MKTQTTTETVTAIKWNQIYVPDANIRRQLSGVEELSEKIKAKGQHTPIAVTNGGTKDQPYTLVFGHRRHAAFELLGWQNREMLAVIRKYAAGDVLGPIADNWSENMDREDVSTLDQAERIHQLLTGTYPVPEGAEAKPLDADAVAALLQISKRQVQKLEKVFKDVDADVAAKARKHGATEMLLVKISQVLGEGETKDKKDESRAKQQMKILDEWIEYKAQLQKDGRQRGVRSDKGKKKAGAKKRGGRKAAEEDEDEGVIEMDAALDDKERTPADYLRLLLFKLTFKMPKEEAAKVEGAIEAIQFMSGERARVSFIKAPDWKALERADKDAEAAAGLEEEEE